MSAPKTFSQLLDETQGAYAARTPRSRTAHDRAASALPGGDTRSSTFFHPYPTYMARGEGPRLFDLDGNPYLDFLNNYTSLVLGHAHPAVAEAVQGALAEQPALGAPHLAQVELGERICRRVPGVERLRFCNSGTEAVMHAVRTARLATGRPWVVKMEGGYHGSADSLEVSIAPDPARAGPGTRPVAVPESRGILPGMIADTLIAPFNDPGACQALLEAEPGQVAAILLEPMMGSAGAIPSQPGYLQRLRELATEHGALLIFDEVQTLRFHPGGAQAYYGVTPDLTAMGKMIGGGFPVGAFGGAERWMSIYDPRRPDSAGHSGTFNGHPVVMAAGCAVLDVLDGPAIDRLNRLGDRLAAGARAAFDRHGLHGQVTGAGSIFNIHFTAEPVEDYRGAARACLPLTRLLHLMLLQRGVFCAKRGMFNTSLAMSEADVQTCLATLDECLAEMRPVISQEWPYLVA